MCGLFGVFLHDVSNDGVHRHDFTGRLKAAIGALAHRGPDDRGIELLTVGEDSTQWQGTLAFGHTRLAIIDLSPGGHQPRKSQDGRCWLVFNGEIYNYRELRSELKSLGHSFETDSDTEVLLAAWIQWGVSGLKRLIGMFAFAVLDREESSLTLVRDAFGIKPLFYCIRDGAVYFGSEISALKALLPTVPQPDAQQAYDYLVAGRYDDSARTFFSGIRHLLPGHQLSLSLDQKLTTDASDKPERWWWPTIEERTDLSLADAAAEFRDLFLNSVRLHLRSDVPVGAALSGGLDSSAIVCAMRHLEPDMPIHTFSFVARGSAIDEEYWADLVNTHVGAIAHKIQVDSSELIRDLEDLVRTQGEPFGSTSIYAQYRVYQAAKEAGIIVTLDGQGADELLAGYSGYPQFYLRSLLDRGSYGAMSRFLHNWSTWPGRGARNAALVLGDALTPHQWRRYALRIVGRDAYPRWLKRDWLQTQNIRAGFPQRHSSASEGDGRRLVERLRAALTGDGLAALLRHGDRNSMRWSIESRVPFLTVPIAEFLLQLPESYLLSPDGQTKRLLRLAMKGIVPDKILDRKDKIGFQTPERSWLSDHPTDVQSWMRGAFEVPFLEGAESARAVCRGLTSRKSGSLSVWSLINFSVWSRGL